MKHRLVVTASLWLALASGISHAEPVDWEARARILSDAVTARPDDTRALCELGWALVNLKRWDEARTTLDVAIAALGQPTAPPMTQRLAACLFNRGQAASGLGDTAQARADYARSLELRPNQTVARALDGLPPPPSTLDERAVLAAAIRACEKDPIMVGAKPPNPQDRARCTHALGAVGPDGNRGPPDPIIALVSPAGCRDSALWTTVTLSKARPGSEVTYERFAVRVRADVAGTIDVAHITSHQDFPEWAQSFGAMATLEQLAPGRCGLVDDETSSGLLRCDIEMDGQFTTTAGNWRKVEKFVFVGDETGVRMTFDVVLDHGDCESGYALDVTFDGRGHALVKRLEGKQSDVPTSALGRHDLFAP